MSHFPDAGLAETGEDLRPHAPVMFLIGLDCRRVALQVDGEHGARYHPCLRLRLFQLRDRVKNTSATFLLL